MLMDRSLGIIRISYNELCSTNEIGGSGWNGAAFVIAIIFQLGLSEHAVWFLFISPNVGPLYPRKKRDVIRNAPGLEFYVNHL